VPDAPWQERLTPVLRQLQMIVGSLVAGCTIFLAIALCVSVGRGAVGRPPLLSYVALGSGVLVLLARAVVPQRIVAAGRQKILRQEGRNPARRDVRESASTLGRLLQLFATSTVVPSVMIEGTALLLLIAYVVEGWLPALIVAVVLIAVLALQMPTRARLIHWIDDQFTLLEQERQRGG
jgi:hypothetical protein